MALTRARLIAGLLCLLLLLATSVLLYLGRIGPVMLHSPEPLRTFDVQAQQGSAQEPVGLPSIAPEEPSSADAPPAPTSAIAVTMPRIAYRYGFAFRLDVERIAAVQEGHLALCRRLGPALCRVTAMQRGGAAEGDAAANLKLQIAASLAESFGRTLVAIAGEGGGDTVDRSIAAEDLSRQMIDSAARIRTREILIQRLTVLLQTRSGNIAQAVEAERAINAAQEELEAARAALADMEGRVGMSAVEINYVARGPASRPSNPIVEAVAQVGSAAASSLGAMIVIVGIALPWALIGGLVFLAIRTIRRRRERGDVALADEVNG